MMSSRSRKGLKRRCRRSSQRTSSSRRSTRPAPKSPARTGGSEVLVSNVRKQYPGADPVVPEALDNPVLTLEGQEFPITGPVQGDDGPGNSVVYIPSLKAVVTGDIAFDHVYFGGPKSPAREGWAKTIDQILALKPVILIPGHEGPGATHDLRAIDFMKKYMADWDANVAASKN